TGLMGGNDPLVAAVEAAGVTTFSTAETAANLIKPVTAEVSVAAAKAPVVADFTGGLGDNDINLAELARAATRDAAGGEEDVPAT
ncbi:hypothetical protein, partial [Bacteroides thetaiotaomicron]|uniref:hypothetical protein n=1 Tax=Bacteroides thetaiotaomicron TaxID=818 RepID=UPI001925E779